MRSEKSADKILTTMNDNHVPNVDQLEFAVANLDQDDHWDDAMKDVDNVISVASPVFFGTPYNEEELIRPAVDGIIRVLKAAKRADVRRVVMTANFGGVGFSNFDLNSVTDESYWTNIDEPGLSIYEKSKSIAERDAWAWVKDNAGEMEFATVNPVAILGPSLDHHISGSFGILKNIIDGSMKSIPNIGLNLVDVRDVAEMHILAMENEHAAG